VHARVEDPDHDLLAEGRHQAGDAQLDLAVGALGLDAPVLGPAALRDVHAGQHLDARGDRRVHRVGNRLDVVEDPVDAKAHHALVLAGLEVDVRRTLVERVVEQVVDRGDHVLVAGAGELLVGAQLHQLHQRAVRRRRAERLLGASHAGAEAVDAIDDGEDVALRGHHELEGPLDQALEALAQRAVVGVGDRQPQGAAGLDQGQHHVTAGEGPRQRAGDQAAIHLERVDLQVGESRGRRDGLGDTVLVEGPARLPGVGGVRGGHQLGRRGVVAGRRLGAHGADPLLQHPAAQRGGAAGDLTGGVALEQALADQQLEELRQVEGSAGLARLGLHAPGLDRLGGFRHARPYRPEGIGGLIPQWPSPLRLRAQGPRARPRSQARGPRRDFAIRSSASARIGLAVAKFSRAKPQPGVPNAAPSLVATFARSRKNA
jgi:hypothetical protein